MWKAPAGPCVFPHVLRKDSSRILPSFQGLQQALVVLVGVLLQPLPLSSEGLLPVSLRGLFSFPKVTSHWI